LFGVHVCTGCDYVSAFSGQGKFKVVNLIRSSDTFCEAFSRYVEEGNIADELFSTMERFPWSIYSRSTKSTNRDMKY
jgi:hypothetical protein